MDLAERLDRAFEQHVYAVTHEAAAQRYAPFLSSVSQVRCRVAPGRGAEEALGAVDARLVTEGANLAVIEAKSGFREKVDGTWLASPSRYTADCERVLLTLLRGLGPWRDSVFLVGGLTPRYLVRARPPDVPHAGTQDVDIVIDLQLLADTEAYHTLEENLRRLGFERAINDKGQKLSSRWQTRTERGAPMVLELLAGASEIAGGRVQPLPTEGGYRR